MLGFDTRVFTVSTIEGDFECCISSQRGLLGQSNAVQHYNE